MKEGKKVLSVQVDVEIIEKLKQIVANERRSQAKSLEIMVEDKYLELIKNPSSVHK